MTDYPEDVMKAADARAAAICAAPIVGVRALATELFADAILAERERCAACQPSTAEDPNESAYQRGRFDGIMEFAAAIRGGSNA